MPVPFKPWIDYPSLTSERLIFVAQKMRDTRNRTVLLHDAEEGDTTWSLGCRVYSRTMARLRKEAQSSNWLRVLPESHNLKFTFAIGAVPVKFYKGEPEDVPTRCLVQSFAELHQMKLAFFTEGIIATHMLRLAVGVDAAGKATFITLVEVDEEGTPLRTFEIPREESENIVSLKPKPIDLAPPRIEVIDDAQEKPETDTGGEEFGSTGTEA